MKKPTIAIAIPAIAICGFAFASPNSENRASMRVVSEDMQDIQGSGATAVSTMTFRDDNFVYVMGDEKSRSFKRINPNATLTDLNNFLYARCWNGHLRTKISHCEPMTLEDARMLDFCIGVQLHVVQAIIAVTLDDMTQSKLSRRVGIPGDDDIKGVNKEVHDIVADLKNKFLYGNDEVRALIRDWATVFRAIPRKVMNQILKDVEICTKSFNDISGNSELDAAYDMLDDSFSLMKGFGYAKNEDGHEKAIGAVLNAALFLWDVYKGEYEPLKPGDMVEGAMRLDVPVVEMKNKWKCYRDEVSVCLEEMRDLRSWLKRSRMSPHQSDARTRKYIQKALVKSGKPYEVFSQWLDYVMYDVPMSVLTYKATGKLKACKGGHWFLNDHEDKMMDVMSEYCQSICGVEMLKHIRTRYAAKGYVDLVAKFKDELSSTEYENFKTETKLYKVVLETDDDGRQQNQLSSM